jgi:hypothetical protein
LYAATSLQSVPGVTVGSCPTTGSGDAEVDVSLPLDTITGIETWVPTLGSITLEGKGVMPCGG